MESAIEIEYSDDLKEITVHIKEGGESLFVDAAELRIYSNGWLECEETDCQKSDRYCADSVLIPEKKVESVYIRDNSIEPGWTQDQ